MQKISSPHIYLLHGCLSQVVTTNFFFFYNLHPDKLLNRQSAVSRNYVNGQGMFWFSWVEDQGAFYSVTRWGLCQQWKWVGSTYLAGIYSSHLISRTDHILSNIIFWHPLLAVFIGKERDHCFLQYIWSGTWWKYKVHLPAELNMCIPLGTLMVLFVFQHAWHAPEQQESLPYCCTIQAYAPVTQSLIKQGLLTESCLSFV